MAAKVAPYLLFGFAVAGLLHVSMRKEFVHCWASDKHDDNCCRLENAWAPSDCNLSGKPAIDFMVSGMAIQYSLER